MSTADHLRQRAQAFCTDFANLSLDTPSTRVEDLAKHFTAGGQAIEHGLTELTGIHGRLLGANQYFDLLFKHLKFHGTEFKPTDFTVDVERKRVFVRGTTRITWKTNELRWNESFVYLLDMEDSPGDSPPFKVKLNEIWADSGAAYVASKDNPAGIMKAE